MVQIKKQDQHKAAFITNQGLFEPTVMFFGLTNSPATFQTMMDTIFREQIAQGWLTVYMDDIAVHTKRREDETKEQHVARHRKLVKEMLAILKKHNLYLNIDKCQFEKTDVDYLGVRIGGKKVQMEEAKVERVRGWMPPRNVREV
jgi:L-rhamnose mutarotase